MQMMLHHFLSRENSVGESPQPSLLSHLQSAASRGTSVHARLNCKLNVNGIEWFI